MEDHRREKRSGYRATGRQSAWPSSPGMSSAHSFRPCSPTDGVGAESSQPYRCGSVEPCHRHVSPPATAMTTSHTTTAHRHTVRPPLTATDPLQPPHPTRSNRTAQRSCRPQHRQAVPLPSRPSQPERTHAKAHCSPLAQSPYSPQSPAPGSVHADCCQKPRRPSLRRLSDRPGLDVLPSTVYELVRSVPLFPPGDGRGVGAGMMTSMTAHRKADAA